MDALWTKQVLLIGLIVVAATGVTSCDADGGDADADSDTDADADSDTDVDADS